eukprot:12928137-Prorocentrum_lima.AAC.1
MSGRFWIFARVGPLDSPPSESSGMLAVLGSAFRSHARPGPALTNHFLVLSHQCLVRPNALSPTSNQWAVGR